MSSTQESTNKEALRRLTAAFNSGDPYVISTAIDEAFQPDVIIRTPLKVDASGSELMRRLWDTLLRGFP